MAAGPLRILMLGPVNQVHVEHMALGVRDSGHDVIVGGELWPGGREPALPGQGIPVHVRTWPTTRWMRRLVRESRADVVHAHWMPIAAQALVYGANPLVVTAWGSDVFRAGRLQRVANRLVANHADVLTGSSVALIRGLEQLGAPSRRTMVLNWGIDLRAFAPPTADRASIRAALGLPSGPLIFSPRWAWPVYNPQIVLRAFDRVANVRDDVTLLFNRAGLDAGALAALRHPDRVRMVDALPHAQMAELYRAADVCVSMAGSDSSPRSVWEAMGCGTPCVLSDLPWVHELIRHGEHALVVPIDEQAAAAAMLRLLDDATLAEHVRSAARRLVEEHRDRETELRRLCAVYERLADEGPRRVRLRRAVGVTAAAGGMAQALLRRSLQRSGRRQERLRVG